MTSLLLPSEKYAFGDDTYHPISKHGTNITSVGGIGYTIVDAIDTLMIMGFDDEVARARDWIRDHLTFDLNATYNTFEVCFINPFPFKDLFFGVLPL